MPTTRIERFKQFLRLTGLVALSGLVVTTIGCSSDQLRGGAPGDNSDARGYDAGCRSAVVIGEVWTIDDSCESDQTADSGPPPNDPGVSTNDTSFPVPDTRDSRTDTIVADVGTDGSTPDTTEPTDVADVADARDGCSGDACDTGSTAPAVDLTGRWVAKGYNCRFNNHLEIMDITRSGDKLTVTKVVGDKCVEAGMTTFRARNVGQLRVGDTISGEIQTGSPDSPGGTWGSETLVIESKNHLSTPGGYIEFRRSSTSNLGSVSVAGQWKTESYECRGNFPKSTMTLNQTQGTNTLAATKTSGASCIVEWTGTRTKTPFSVTIEMITSTGKKAEVPGEARLLAEDFLVVEPKNLVWSIRMQRQSLF